jgi:Na+-transporting NADH:ubiquinone oxidoreductase subunit A
MAVHKITKGLDLPIAGQPLQIIRGEVATTRVAIMADDFPGMKPGMRVEEGETVKRGQVLFEDRKSSGVLHTAPGAGRIIGIHRGARRALQSVVIDLSDGERSGKVSNEELQTFEHYTGKPTAELDRDGVRNLLVESGLWTAIRMRPFAKVPATGDRTEAIFVTAMDSNPLAALPEVVIEREPDAFASGLELVSKLTDGETILCLSDSSTIDRGLDAPVRIERFAGPHPAGTAGLHIHLVKPASRHRPIWYIGYQDVIAIGRLFATGRLDLTRVISIAGPPVADPRLVVSRVGAHLHDIAAEEESSEEERRLISGSVLSGKKAMGDVYGFMGRYDLQVSVLAEDREKVFIGWLTPGWNAFSVIPIYLSKIFGRNKRFDFTTSTNGSPRAMVPIGLYEKVMPFDILPTVLLRSLLVGDVEKAEQLGALELAEEDLALCTYVCPGKTDYGPVLRRNLEMIEKEG